ncbi:MAG: DUF1566 domain-containing protein [Deltaproteobacteria bacterium]|nr:DUF1566 domain-containing protein [Deltaproteobacteria bacterium]
MILPFHKKLLFSFLVLFLAATGAHSATEKEGVSLVVEGEGGPAALLPLYDRMTAVIIGIDAYQDFKADQKQSVRDAKTIEDILGKKYNVSRLVTLYNEEATGDNILKALRDDLSSAGLDEAVLVYFSGQGATRPVPQGDMGYIVPHDGSVKPDEMYKNISLQQIREEVGALIPAKHVLFIMDACMGDSSIMARPAMREASDGPSYLREATRGPARQMIIACGKNEKQASNGPFADRLIEALNNNSGFIYASALGAELQQKAGREKQHSRTGWIYGMGDFMFAVDPGKVLEEADSDIPAIEAEIKDLEARKEETPKKKKAGVLKDLERKKALKETALKQAMARRESAAKEVERRRTIVEDADKNPAEKTKLREERAERLAYLKQQAVKMKQELMSSAPTLGLPDAQAEIRRINGLMARLEGGKEANPDTKARADIEKHMKALATEKKRTMRQEFPLDDKGIKWRFIECNPEKEEFYLSATVGNETIYSRAVIPKARVMEYCRKPDMLNVGAVVTLSEDALPQAPRLIVRGPDKEVYPAKNLERSRFIPFNLTVLDTETNLAWAADTDIGRKMSWYDAGKHIKQMNDRKYAGYGDWRMPTKEELEKLADYAKNKGIKKDIFKAFNEAGFRNVKSDMYWSSASSPVNANLAWIIYMWNGYMDYANKSKPNYIWPVRSGQ